MPSDLFGLLKLTEINEEGEAFRGNKLLEVSKKDYVYTTK